MSVSQKLAMLKFRFTSVTLLSLRNLEAAPEETMQSSMQPRPLQYLKKPASNRVKHG